MKNALLMEEHEGDSLEKAQCILDFVQSWVAAPHHYELSENQMYGLGLTLEAASLFITKAQKMFVPQSEHPEFFCSRERAREGQAG